MCTDVIAYIVVVKIFSCIAILFHNAGRKPGRTNYGEKYKLPVIAVVSMHFSVNMFLVVEHEIVCSINVQF